MKIGILTYHWVPNFGANLQTLSTVLYLKDNGFDPIVINWIPEDTEKWYNGNTSKEQIAMHNEFAQSFYNLSQLCRNEIEIHTELKRLNINKIIIGSDSLFNIIKPYLDWRFFKKIQSTTDHKFPNPFWGSFDINNNIRLCGLSISNQNANFKSWDDKKNEIKRSLLKFKYLSVRDSYTQEMVSYFTDKELIPKITPDPVFCFNHNNPPLITKKTILEKYNLPEKYILLSFSGGKNSTISKSWVEKFEHLCSLMGYACVCFPRTSGGQIVPVQYKISLPLLPLDWYYLIKYSMAYVGVLMHPIVVALHNNVPFFSFDHYGIKKYDFIIKKKTSKIYNLLQRADMLNNYYNLYSQTKRPSASYVFDKIVNFDFAKCKLFSQFQEKEVLASYKTIMNQLID